MASFFFIQISLKNMLSKVKPPKNAFYIPKVFIWFKTALARHQENFERDFGSNTLPVFSCKNAQIDRFKPKWHHRGTEEPPKLSRAQLFKPKEIYKNLEGFNDVNENLILRLLKITEIPFQLRIYEKILISRWELNFNPQESKWPTLTCWFSCASVKWKSLPKADLLTIWFNQLAGLSAACFNNSR